MTNRPIRSKRGQVALLALAFVSLSGSRLLPAGELPRSRVQEAYGSLPLTFEANDGQADPAVKFLTRGSGYTVFLTQREAVLALTGVRTSTREARRAVVRMALVGATPAAAAGVDKLPGKSHYLFGNEERRWRTDVAQYAKVEYNDVYPDIDLVYYGNQGRLEYDFVVGAGADPHRIQLSLAGARDVRLDEDGALVLAVDGGELRQHKPVVYQVVDGVRREIAGRYRLSEGNRVSFDIGAYDHGRELVIDPVLSFATYLGGGASGQPFGGEESEIRLAVDRAGYAYVVGATISPDFPAMNDPSPSLFEGIPDLFVTKLNRTGTAVVYSTFLGGNSSDTPFDIAVDGEGNAYITGRTQSLDFPTTVDSFQPSTSGSAEGFVTKLNAAGGLVFSSYLGGSDFDGGTGIVIDRQGSCYVTGTTSSSNFPVSADALKPVPTDFSEMFVAKVNRTGTALVYSTYLGGSSFELSTPHVAVDRHGRAIVAGQTYSGDFPTTDGAFQRVLRGTTDGFVAKLNRRGTALIYSTLIGGSSYDDAIDMALDRSGRVHVTGSTSSPDFPVTSDAVQTAHAGDSDAFVATLSRRGTSLVYATYLGGSRVDVGLALAVDWAGRPHVTGSTNSPDFPITSDAFQRTVTNRDAFVAILDRRHASLIFSTSLGGGGIDAGSGIGVARLHDLYVAGQTRSADFPTTPGVFQPVSGGGPSDAFVAKIDRRKRKE